MDPLLQRFYAIFSSMYGLLESALLKQGFGMLLPYPPENTQVPNWRCSHVQRLYKNSKPEFCIFFDLKKLRHGVSVNEQRLKNLDLCLKDQNQDMYLMKVILVAFRQVYVKQTASPRLFTVFDLFDVYNVEGAAKMLSLIDEIDSSAGDFCEEVDLVVFSFLIKGFISHHPEIMKDYSQVLQIVAGEFNLRECALMIPV